MGGWFIATEGVKIVKDSASLWPQIITAVSSAGAALGGVYLAHYFTRQREERAAAAKQASERRFITTELVFLLERYAIKWLEVDIERVALHYKAEKIPSLNLLTVAGNWRALDANQIFRIREFDANQAVMFLTLKLELSEADYVLFLYEDRVYVLTQAIKAFLLAAKLRREVGLPDSVHLKGNQGVLVPLYRARKVYRRHILKKRKEKATENDNGE
ncbi:hypothetical protein OQJ40_22370 [Serratia nevei]|uniref:hypothetical protein n=1 Tax=Serratia nevei TaxID=2703794 RepID=UPI00114F6F43|nr:hypothetical protein [Serratia nevei]QDI34830.1 hypothetical protein FG170_22050 [Serratia marcescens]WMC74905.1 hypothetical protein O8I25_22125 [Serratia nevei]WMC80303.1 hypothetical protein O8I24_22360 [Serratia nevei]